jgi:hypothetical protein
MPTRGTNLPPMVPATGNGMLQYFSLSEKNLQEKFINWSKSFVRILTE